MCSTLKQNLSDSYAYHLLKHIAEKPEQTQRDLAQKIGLSASTINFCIRALIEKGCIKAINFKNSNRKAAYLYKLTPKGIEEKARVTVRFLKAKAEEYERVKAEVEELRREVKGLRDWELRN
jgi:EPS-associated MarR family transcriptional regulator